MANHKDQEQISSEDNKMTSVELRTSAALALIFFLRMFGLFMILPVLSLYTDDMSGATPLLIGMALGIYGLTQATLQIPFGFLSDRIGRKPVIAFGLLVFVIGSIIAALSDNIHQLILGRALQGAGAIASSLMALAADMTRESQRTKAMAIIGISIGMAFILSFIAGSVLDVWLGLQGLFWIAALLGMTAVIVLFTWVPTPGKITFHQEIGAKSGNLSAVLKNPDLLRLDISILILHLVLTASFVVIPLALRDQAGLATTEHWKVYLPVMLLSVLLMAPFVRIADQKQIAKQLFVGAVILLAVAEAGMWLSSGLLFPLAILLLLFFTAFNYLEAALPSLVSRSAPETRKGTALGVYSTSQFLGAFLGGVIGGWTYGQSGVTGVFLINTILLILWLIISLRINIKPSITQP